MVVLLTCVHDSSKDPTLSNTLVCDGQSIADACHSVFVDSNNISEQTWLELLPLNESNRRETQPAGDSTRVTNLIIM